mgnify:CR=1 FL=1
MQVREPWRAEWLDADFKYLDAKGHQVASDKKGTLSINYKHQLKNGVLVPQYGGSLETCLMEDRKIGLASMNKQGLPTKEGNDFDYYSPRKDNNSVARFWASSVRAGLYCYGGPAYSYSSLGVRHVREARNFKK